MPFGDFNLPNLNWLSLGNDLSLTPSNICNSCESYFIDNLLGLGLVQVNSLRNSLNRLLDLIFISANIDFSLSQPASSISPPNLHHMPMVFEIRFIEFFDLPTTYANSSFNFARCDFNLLNSLISEIDWQTLFGDKEIAGCFDIFKCNIAKLCTQHVPTLNNNKFKLPWSTNKLRRLKICEISI